QDSAPPAGDRGLSAWMKGESSGTAAWLGASTSGGDSRDEALRKWLAGEDTAFQDWLGVPTSSGVGRPTRGTPDRLSDDKVRELREKALETDGMREELETEAAKLRSVNETLKKQIESGFAKLKPDQREMKKQEAGLMEREAALRANEERIAAIHPDEATAPSEELKRRLEEELREME